MNHTRIPIFIAIIFLLFPFIANAQTLSGRITNKITGHAIVGANIYIEDLKTGIITDSEGNYLLKNIHHGTYTIVVRALGYAPITKYARLKGEETYDFAMETAQFETPEVVVTGNAMATGMRNTPQPVTEVSHQYLLRTSATNIIDAIANIPGVSAISDGQSISKPVIRGLGYNRVVTINDGVRQEGQQWGDEFGIEVDPDAVDRVEILKGPASLVYGSDAVSGVVNLLPERTAPEGKILGDILYNYQDNNGLSNISGHITGNVHGITFSGRISSIMAHAYQNKYDGYVFNSQFSNFSFNGAVGLHRKWGFSELRFSYFNLKTGIVEGERDEATGKFVRQVGFDTASHEPITQIATNQELKSYTPFLINQDVKHYKLTWDNSLAVGNGRVTGRFAWQQNRRQENNDIANPDNSNIYYVLNTLNYDLRYVSPMMNRFNFSAGVNGMYQDSKNKGTLLLIPEYNLFDFGAFAIASKRINALTLSAGVRYDMRQFKGHDDYVDMDGNHVSPTDPNAIHQFVEYNSNFNGVSGSFGAVYNFSPAFYIKANAATGFRAPNVAESGSNGVHDGTVIYEIGDPNLKAENNLEFDVTPGFQTKDISAEVSVFVNSFKNFIYTKRLKGADGGDSIRNDVPGYGSAPAFKYSQTDAVLTGLEAAVDIHPSGIKWLDWYTTYSMVNAQLKNVPDSVKYLPFTTPACLRSEVTFTLRKLNKNFRNAYFRFGVAYTFEQPNVDPNAGTYAGATDLELAATKATFPGYTLLNTGIGSDIMVRGNKICSIYINVNNLANTPYVDYMSRFKYNSTNYSNGVDRVGVYNMGRNVSFKVIVPLDFK